MQLARTQQPNTKLIFNIKRIEFYKYLNKIKYDSSNLVNYTHLYFQEMKNTLNMYLNQLIIPCKPPACSNTTIQ